MADLKESLENLGQKVSQGSKNLGEKINQGTKVNKEHTEEKARDIEAKTKSKL